MFFFGGLGVRRVRGCCAPTWFGLARAWKKRFSVRKQYLESAWDTNPDPVFYLNAAPDLGSQTNPNMDSDLAFPSHENFNYKFA